MGGKLKETCLAAVALLLVSSACAGRVYRCTSGPNQYYSERPCPGVQGKMGMSGASAYSYESRSRYHSSSGELEKAPEHAKYLRGACASMNDAIRTAPTRGVRSQVIYELRAEYERKCGVDDRAARDQSSQDRRDERAQQLSMVERARQSRSEVEQKARQCDAMRDALVSRRRRIGKDDHADMAALQTSEKLFNAKCVGG